MTRKKIKANFWIEGAAGDKALYADELGWPESLKKDAQSDYSETIFRFVVEITGFNLLFYWTVDENFYSIETEKDPIEVRRIYPNPDWDGNCEFLKSASNFGPNTASPGEVIATFQNPTEIWGNLKIDGVPIHDVIEESLIITWD